MATLKPFSQACENNKAPIAQVLRRAFAKSRRVFEIGSGTGQHAVHMARALPHLTWQTSDRAENLAGLRLWLAEAALENLPPPVEFDVFRPWSALAFDAAFSSNTTHIMPWQGVQLMVQGVAERLPEGGLFALYGPFNYHGQFTSDSNRNFDAYLRQADAHQGIRDFDQLNGLAEQAHLSLLEDNEMPANNRLLLWRKR